MEAPIDSPPVREGAEVLEGHEKENKELQVRDVFFMFDGKCLCVFICEGTCTRVAVLVQWLQSNAVGVRISGVSVRV